MFPIFWRGVWEDPQAGANAQRTKDRERWASVIKGMRPQAVELLKSMQPRERGANEEIVNFLCSINTLSNTDRHPQFPVVASALTGAVVRFTDANGLRKDGHDPRTRQAHYGLPDHAVIEGLPPGATNVEIIGTPAVTVRAGRPLRDMELLPDLAKTVERVREFTIAPLIPYLHVPGRR